MNTNSATFILSSLGLLGFNLLSMRMESLHKITNNKIESNHKMTKFLMESNNKMNNEKIKHSFEMLDNSLQNRISKEKYKN